MHRVYISGTTGTNNIKLTNCTFDGTTDPNAQPVDPSSNTSVYSNAPGKIELINCEFKNISLGVNINNKSTGAQDISISGCTFTDCATAANSADWSKFAAPIRLVTSGEGAKIDTKITDTTITGTNVGNGDILLGDGRKGQKSSTNVALNISGTKAKVIIQEQGTEDENGKITPAKEINVTKDDTNKVIEMSTVDNNIKWEYDTDSGFYVVGDQNLGMMRFMFNAGTINDTVTEAGIKYISAAKLGQSFDEGSVSIATDSTAVQGDIVDIPEGTNGTYYAAAYLKTATNTFWSKPLACTINWKQQFTNYKITEGGNN